MTKDRWAKIQTLFEQAISLGQVDLDTFLENECAGDKDLLEEVRSLLQADQDVPEFLDGIALDSFKFDENPDLVGKNIGAYKIVRRVAEGGMGTVYLAERSDGQFERQVALKVIKKGLDSQQVIRRFNRERQILARLHHPNIARLYDGGLTTDGRPYFTMEYIDGLPVDAYCDTNNLTIRERLKLLATVLETVSYAHRNLIIHRDLKPGNIFITNDGKVKLLDFGIARLLDEKESEDGPLTRAGYHILTPEYAAPEQLRSGEASVSTDIYQIGVVLYELLKGQRPYNLHGKSLAEIEGIVNEQTAGKLSDLDIQNLHECAGKRRTSARELKNTLSSDLEKIAAKALEKDTFLRYLTIDALQEDIQNYLSGHPVSASKSTLIYRTNKFIKRHRLAMTVAMSVLLIFISLSTYYTIQLANERDKARTEAEKAQQIASFMSTIFEIANPEESKDHNISALELLDRGAERVQEDLKNQPEIQAELMYTLGNVNINIGRYDQAEPLIKKSLALRKNLFGFVNEDVSQTLSALNKVFYELGKYDSSEATIRQKIELCKQLYNSDHPDLALAYNDLAWIRLEKGDYKSADSLNRLALDMRKRLFGPQHVDVAESISNLGSTQYGLGNLDRAKELYNEALVIRLKMLDNDHPLIAMSYNNLGLVNEELENYNQADSFYTAALNLNVKLYGPVSPQVAWSYQDLSRLAAREDNYEKAISLVRKSNEIREKTLGKDHILLAYSLDYLGDAFLQTNRLDSAEVYYRKSIHIYQNADSSTWVYMASPLKGMGQVLLKKKKYREAEHYLRRALQLRESNLPPGNYVIARARTALAECLIKLKNFEQAEDLLLSANEIFEKLGDVYRNSHIQTLEMLVTLYTDWPNEQKIVYYSDLLSKTKS